MLLCVKESVLSWGLNSSPSRPLCHLAHPFLMQISAPVCKESVLNGKNRSQLMPRWPGCSFVPWRDTGLSSFSRATHGNVQKREVFQAGCQGEPLFFFFFFATVGGMQGSWLLGLQWKRRVLTTGRPGKSPEPHFFVVFSYFLVLGLHF